MPSTEETHECEECDTSFESKEELEKYDNVMALYRIYIAFGYHQFTLFNKPRIKLNAVFIGNRLILDCNDVMLKVLGHNHLQPKKS